jgi:hypothetical protein
MAARLDRIAVVGYNPCVGVPPESAHNGGSVENELLLRALAALAEGVARIIGERGARAVIREAGHHALGSLFDWLPLRVPLEEALERAGLLLQEFGVVSGFMCHLEENQVRISGSVFSPLSVETGNPSDHPISFFLYGLYEGAVQMMSGSKINVTLAGADGQTQVWQIRRLDEATGATNHGTSDSPAR